MGRGFAFPEKPCSSFQVSTHLSDRSAMRPDHPSHSSLGRLTLPCLPSAAAQQHAQLLPLLRQMHLLPPEICLSSSALRIRAFKETSRKMLTISDYACLKKALIGRRGGLLMWISVQYAACFFPCEEALKTQIPTLKPKPARSVRATSKSPTPWCQNCTCSSAADLSTKYITCQLLELGSWGEGNH